MLARKDRLLLQKSIQKKKKNVARGKVAHNLHDARL